MAAIATITGGAIAAGAAVGRCRAQRGARRVVAGLPRTLRPGAARWPQDDRRADPRLAARASRLPTTVRAAAAGASRPSSVPLVEKGERVLVWYKHDLRTDDHIGLVAAADAAAEMVPLFVFDPEQFKQVLRSPGGAEALYDALRALRKSLRSRGSELLVRVGRWEEEVVAAAKEVGAAVVITEEEVEHGQRQACARVERLLEQSCRLSTWRLSLFDANTYTENYREFAVRMGAALPPLSCPRLPPLPPGATPGDLPPLEALQEAAERVQAELLPHARSMDDDQWVRSAAVQLSHDEDDLLSSLTDYLSYENVQPSELHLVVRGLETPAGPGSSFRALFAHALMLGTLSRRRVYELAAKRSQSASVGLRSALGDALAALSATPTPSSLTRTAMECAMMSDFHWQLAAADMQRTTPSGLTPRWWRWRGILTQFLEAEPAEGADPSLPPILLVHGFGAFGEHWRGNINALASAGFRVLAPTYPGYGRSEKTMTTYGQGIWTDFLRDFVLDIVKEPVTVAGLVLVNSAGPITSKINIAEVNEPTGGGKPPFWIANTVSRLLISYLETSIGKTLGNLYPTNPLAADSYLADEIYRAACDPGALGVFRSVFYLPPPRPLNYLVDTYGGPTMILQGKLDPLNDAVGRAEELRALCKTEVELHLLEAGHCPHDETPGVVNEYLASFARRCAAAAPTAAEKLF
eukprot:jgi/Tetstr1/461713/TSEL_000607.t1